jgi:hypothetical protein
MTTVDVAGSRKFVVLQSLRVAWCLMVHFNLPSLSRSLISVDNSPACILFCVWEISMVQSYSYPVHEDRVERFQFFPNPSYIVWCYGTQKSVLLICARSYSVVIVPFLIISSNQSYVLSSLKSQSARNTQSNETLYQAFRVNWFFAKKSESTLPIRTITANLLNPFC